LWRERPHSGTLPCTARTEARSGSDLSFTEGRSGKINFYHYTTDWLKISKRIKYKVLSLKYKSLETGQPYYLCSLFSFYSHRCTRSSSLITLSRPSLTPRLKIANRSYYHSAPVLRNSLPFDLCHVAYHIIPSPILN